MPHAAVQYVILKPLLVDLGGEGLEMLPAGHVLTDEQLPYFPRLRAMVDHGKIGMLPKRIEEPAEFSDEQLLAELERRGLSGAAGGSAAPKRKSSKTAARAEA